MSIQSVCVFCGSKSGVRPEYEAAARAFGTALAQQGLTLVYGAGHLGLMGAVADAALAAGGKVIGVIPAFLRADEVAHMGLTELHVTQTMHERKAKMAELSDAFVALPGGLGTMDELFEILTWAQLSVHDKPVGLLDVAGFYQPLMAMVRHACSEGFAPERNLNLFALHQDIAALLAHLQHDRAPAPHRLALGQT
jgi:uncharacterized protein (TIGR00730 family)